MPPKTTPRLVAAVAVFAGPRLTDPYIAIGICLECAVKSDLRGRVIEKFRLSEIVAGCC